MNDRVLVDAPASSRVFLLGDGLAPQQERTLDGRGPRLVRHQRMRVVRLETRDGAIALDPELYAVGDELLVDVGDRAVRPIFRERTKDTVHVDMAPVLDDDGRRTSRWIPLDCLVSLHAPGGARAARRRETRHG